MSQKFIKKKQTSPKALGYGKFYAKAVYNQKHITTRQLADFIQTQASVKRPKWHHLTRAVEPTRVAQARVAATPVETTVVAVTTWGRTRRCKM